MEKAGERFLVWGYYGYGNLGDELMLKVIVDKITSARPGSTIRVRCFNPPSVGAVTPFPVEKGGMRIPVIKHIAYMARVLNAISRTDNLVVGGGTLFLDKGRHNQSMFFLASAVFFAKLLGKRVYIIGVGVDPLTHPANIGYLKLIFKKCDYLALRDAFSYETGIRIAAGKRVTRSSDILFDGRFVDSLTKDAVSDRKAVVVSFSDYFSTWGGEEERALLRQRARELVETLVEKYGLKYSIVLCAFQKTIGEKDYEFLDDLRKAVSAKGLHDGKAVRLEYIDTEERARDIFRSSVFTIGMRYHALVLSAIFRRPFFGIDMEMKINQICREFDMPYITMDDFLKKGIDGNRLESVEFLAVPEEKVDAHIRDAALNFCWLT